MTITVKSGETVSRSASSSPKKLIELQYKRETICDFSRGTFRVRGDTVDVFPAHYEDRAWRLAFFGDEVESISEFDPLTGKRRKDLEFAGYSASTPTAIT